jgi:hypothetical protein
MSRAPVLQQSLWQVMNALTLVSIVQHAFVIYSPGCREPHDISDPCWRKGLGPDFGPVQLAPAMLLRTQ